MVLLCSLFLVVICFKIKKKLTCVFHSWLEITVIGETAIPQNAKKIIWFSHTIKIYHWYLLKGLHCKIYGEHRIQCFSTLISLPPLFQSPSEVYSWRRPTSLHKSSVPSTSFYGEKKKHKTPKQSNCVILSDTNQVVRILPPGEVPLKDIYSKGKDLLIPNLPSWLKVAYFLLGIFSVSLPFHVYK